MGKIIKMTSRKPITGNDLLELWPGIAPCVLAEMIDAKNADYTDTEPEKKILDFPRVYALVADLLRDPETQKIHARCISCKPNYKKGEKYRRPYRRLSKGRYDFSELIFRPSEVKAYEKLYPEVFWERINPEDTPLARNSKQKKDISRLQREIKKLKFENDTLKSMVAELKAPSENIFMPNPEEQIKEWERVLPTLKKKTQITAARLAIEKWKGKTHREAYDIVRSDDPIANKEQFVTRKKDDAQSIVDDHQDYELKMPPWRAH